MTTLFLVRHGETFANCLGYIQGTMDNRLSSLTKKGIAESERFQSIIKELKVDEVYSSPLGRAIQTSEIICSESDLQVVIDPALAEVSYGKWNGTKISELPQEFGDDLNEDIYDLEPSVTAVNEGETYQQAKNRIDDFIARITADCDDKNVLVVTHGWIIKTLVNNCLLDSNDHKYATPRNLSLTKLEFDGVNRHAHLDYYDSRMKMGTQI